MLFFSRVIAALLAALTLVQASTVARNSSDGNEDVWFCGFIYELNKNNLTILADKYKSISETSQGQSIIGSLKNGGDITLLAPENCAFNLSDLTIDPNVLLYNALSASIDKGFTTSGTSLTRRDGAVQSHSLVPSQFGASGGGARKRQGAQYATQVVQQTFTPGSRKRWATSEISVDRPIGSGKVKGRFTYKNLIILIIDTVLTLPPKGSDVFSQPLISSAPHGFTKFGGGLNRTGLIDRVDSCDQVTVFLPLDDSFCDINKLSKEELKCLLENHLVFGRTIYSTQFGSATNVTTESGKGLELSFENDVHYVKCGQRKSMVLRRDVIPGNGVIHVIDKPLECD